MTKALTVHNAEIATATVEIKTLTMSGRQVTQAVFRQLIEKPLVSHDGTFNGLPWGVVNYHPPHCGGWGTHLHVVWQEGHDLRRSVEGPSDDGDFYDHELDTYLLAHCTVAEQRGFGAKAPPVLPAWAKSKGTSYGHGHRPEVSFVIDGLPVVANHPRFCDQSDIEEAKRNVDEAYVRSEVKQEANRRARRAERWAEIQALPQLFIAV